jgi:hypothetical protein
MKTWIITAVVLGILLVAGIFVANINLAKAADSNPAQKVPSCSGCSGNSCTAEKNCGLSTCGAVNGGKCTCGK